MFHRPEGTTIEKIIFRWRCLLGDLRRNKFDYQIFTLLAKDTFMHLYLTRDEKNLSKDLVQLLLLINDFENCLIKKRKKKYKAAMCVAREECADGFFVVYDEKLNKHIIDTNTFDLTPILESI